MGKYLISGIGPGSGGVGRLMKALVPAYTARGYEIIYKHENRSLKKLLVKLDVAGLIKEAFSRVYNKLYFSWKLRNISDSKILFMHPQTAGFDLLFRLIQRNNEVSLYVMDNSFFCMTSYNTHPVEKRECFQCIEEANPHSLCRPFPIRLDKAKYLEHLGKLKKLAGKIHFLAQNEKQKLLLQWHFGKEASVEVYGMDPGEVSDEVIPKTNFNTEVEIVLHGAPVIAKGIEYFIDVASYLPTYKFIVPSSRKEVVKLNSHIQIPQNVEFREMTWESGLKELVANANLVFNPSLWSAPIEGALLKSASYNDNVATVESRYGYESEYNGIKNHLRLPLNTKDAAQAVQEFLQSH